MLEAFGLSDPGCVRTNNEDVYAIDKQSGIFILADGMGGANAGEFAAQLSVKSIHDLLLQAPPRDGSGILTQAFIQTNQVVRQAARSKPELEGMGTTLLVAHDIGDNQLEVGSVGDSRAYHASGNGLFLITQDQTWVAEVGSRLGLSDEALRKHPMRHVLTMAVGTTEDLRIDCHRVRLRVGDQLLLCSDGLHGVLEEKTLRDTLNSEKSLADKCHYLVEAAKEKGGPDNVTVVLIQLV